MAEKIQGKQGCRIKSLTRDTSLGIQQTCNGLIELSKYLLDDGQEYVLLGEFTTDTWRLCSVNSGKDLEELTLLMFKMLLKSSTLRRLVFSFVC